MDNNVAGVGLLTGKRGRGFGRWWTWLPVLALVWLSGCGGGEPPAVTRFVAALPAAIEVGNALDATAAQALAPRRRALTASSAAGPRPGTAPITGEAFFAWAEQALPGVFPGPQPTLQVSDIDLRYYPSTETILAVWQAQVFLLGPATGGQVLRIAALEDFHCLVRAEDCGAAPAMDLLSLSTAAPMATEGVAVKLRNWQPDQPTTVTVTVDGQSHAMPWRPSLRDPDTLVVVPPPMVLDAELTTRAYRASVRIEQAGSAVSFALDVADLPTLAEFGTQPGDITRAVTLAGLHLRARTLNTLQALAACTTCGLNGPTDAALLAGPMEARQAVLRAAPAWLQGITALQQGAVVNLTVPGVQPGDAPRQATLSRAALVLSDRILGAALARTFEASATAEGQRQAQSLRLGSKTPSGLSLSSLASAAEAVTKTVSQTFNGVDTALSLGKSLLSDSGNLMDAAKAVGGVLGGVALVAGVAGAATVAAPAALAAAVIGYGVGVVAAGDLLANAYDYVTTDNASVRAQASQNMANDAWDVLGGALATGALATGIKGALVAGPSPNSFSWTNTVGDWTDATGKLIAALDANKPDQLTAIRLLNNPPQPPLDTAQTAPGGSRLGSQAGGVTLGAADPSRPTDPTMTSFGPANADSTMVFPPGWLAGRDLQLRATDPVTGQLLASTALPRGTVKSGGKVTVSAFCTFAGGYVGPFTGTTSGGANVSVISDGRISGGGQTTAGQSLFISGSLSPTGSYQASASGGTSDGASFAGTLYSTGTGWVIEGTWVGGGGGSGVFRLSRSCADG